MIIKFTNYADGIHYLQLRKKADKLNLDEPFKNDVLLDCKMDKSHHQIVLSCDLSVLAELTCDRCNEEFERQLKIHFENIYLFKKSDNPPDEIGVYELAPETDKIDVSEDAAEYAKLAIPMKILCNEDCLGLCLKCGTNLNISSCRCSEEEINPVWESLEKLKNKLNQQK